jgi:hypothetical protein
VPDQEQGSPLSLEGEIVEIIESGGVSSIRVVLHQMRAFDLDPGLVADLHLGDRIAIEGLLRVEVLHSLPDVDPAARTLLPGYRPSES